MQSEYLLQTQLVNLEKLSLMLNLKVHRHEQGCDQPVLAQADDWDSTDMTELQELMPLLRLCILSQAPPTRAPDMVQVYSMLDVGWRKLICHQSAMCKSVRKMRVAHSQNAAFLLNQVLRQLLMYRCSFQHAAGVKAAKWSPAAGQHTDQPT